MNKLERQSIVHGKRVLGYNGLKIGNVLPIELRIGNSREVFKENVKTLSVDGQKKTNKCPQLHIKICVSAMKRI